MSDDVRRGWTSAGTRSGSISRGPAEGQRGPDSVADGAARSVLGASRFLGRLAIPMFVAEGWRVRALDRRQAAIAGMLGVERDWADPLDERSLTRVTTDCTCVLDLGSSESGAEAVATTEAAVLAGGAGRIIRLERLGEPVAAPGGDPARVTVVRCAPVIGAGAPWVVILRALGDRLPVIPCPAWMRRATEPVAAADAGARARLARGRRAPPIPPATTSQARIARPIASCSRLSRPPTAGGRGSSTPASPASRHPRRARRRRAQRAGGRSARSGLPRARVGRRRRVPAAARRAADHAARERMRAAPAGGRRRGI